ncbi:MAG TPA: apolipoprotein N-acyltransferase [Woeseiaceae bacterium]|nr:apolipoprotein N-acyltransferase [Woeseiaceae bacterium]
MSRQGDGAGTAALSARAPLRQLLDVHPFGIALAYLAAGTMLTLAFAPLGGWALAPVLVFPVLTLCLYSQPRRAALYGFWFGFGLFLFGTYWVYISIHEFGQAPVWLAVALTLGLVTVMALYYALTAWLIARLARGRPARLLLAAPAAWAAVEWLRGWLLTGFPWLTLGYSQVDSPLAGWLPVVGVYGVSFLVVLSTAAFVTALALTGRARRNAIVVAVLPWVLGLALGGLEWVRPAGSPLTATIVQGGIPQELKWRPERFQETLEVYGRSLVSHADSDLVVWPEVAIPAAAEDVDWYLELLEGQLRHAGQSLVLGIQERENDRYYNSVLLLDGQRRQFYRKRHLVPFGEYFPVPESVRQWMRMRSLPSYDMAPGAPEQPLLELPDATRLAVMICYEDAYGAEQLYALPDAELLVNVSNDAWFGDSIAPHQHLEIARTRALETGRYMIRATNNGISAFIDPRGGLAQTAAQFEYATLTMPVRPMSGITPYARMGNWPAVVVALALVAWLAWRPGALAARKAAPGLRRRP